MDLFKKKKRKWLWIATGGTIAAFSVGYFLSGTTSQIVPIVAWNEQMKKDCANLNSSSDSDISVGSYDENIQSMARAVGKAMKKAYGYNPAFVYAMIGQETGFGKGYTNALKNYNLSGIQYDATYMSDIATPGEIVGDGAGKGVSTYAKFKSLDDYAKVFYQIYLKPDFEGKNPKTVEEWATLLKKHHYFEGDLATYIKNMNFYADQYKDKYGKDSASDDDDQEIALSETASSDYDSVDFSKDGVTAEQCKALGYDVGDDDDDGAYGDWAWPIAGIGKNKAPAYVDGGQFGVTSYSRGKTNFHDGFDFSSGANGFNEGSAVYAVTDATVYKTGYAEYADEYIWLRTSDGYNIIYQEGFNSNDIKVKEGDKVKAGEKIAILGSGKTHVHLGITTDSRNPGLKKSGNPVYFGFDHPKAWMNPITVISNGIKKGNSIGSITLTGEVSTNAKLLAGVLKKIDKKATDNGIAAILGNWYTESTLNPTSVNPLSGATGLGQWLGNRLTNLKNYADSKNKKLTDPTVQLQFAYYAEGSDSQIFKKVLRSNDSYESLALKFSQEWEVGGYHDKHVNGARIVAKALGVN